jgi:hypothetical protein
MRTQTKPGDAVPAIESPRIRALSAQKKRTVAATGKSLFNGDENSCAQQPFDEFNAEISRGVIIAVQQAPYGRQICLGEIEPTHASSQARALEPRFQCIPKPHQRLGAEALDGRELGHRTQRSRAPLSPPGAVEKGSGISLKDGGGETFTNGGDLPIGSVHAQWQGTSHLGIIA